MDIKESRKTVKYLDLARELRKQWNIRVSVILVVIGALGTFLYAWKGDFKNLK